MAPPRPSLSSVSALSLSLSLSLSLISISGGAVGRALEIDRLRQENLEELISTIS
jgi:hypothetical protein